jgi:two-component system invasion response regulator UvrY
MVRVFLIEPQALPRAALQMLLDSVPDLRVSGVAADIGGAPRDSRTTDVILLAAHDPLPAMALARRLRGSPLTCILAAGAVAFARPLLDCGVRGLVTACSAPDEVFACLRRVHGGHVHLSPDIARRMALGGSRPPFDTLSAREWQVLLMMARGDSAQTIARALCLSPKTVSTYRCRILHKLGVRSDLDLLRLALRAGFEAVRAEV